MNMRGWRFCIRRKQFSRRLKQCHEEIFQRILETPLALKRRSQNLPGRNGRAGEGDDYALAADGSVPDSDAGGSPEYLKELFCSNLRGSRDSAYLNCQGSLRRMTTPTTRPTISASWGNFQDS